MQIIHKIKKFNCNRCYFRYRLSGFYYSKFGIEVVLINTDPIVMSPFIFVPVILAIFKPNFEEQKNIILYVYLSYYLYMCVF